MHKLLMLGTSIASKELVLLAKSQGIYTIVTDYFDPEKSEAKQVADEHWKISTADTDVLAEKCREEGVTAVICGLSEFNIPKAAELGKKLGLPFYCTAETWAVASNKYLFKEACHKYKVPVATDYFLSNPPTQEELDAIKLPVVVKAVNLCGNQGMTYCYTKEDVVRGCEFARTKSKTDKVIVERMLHGMEYEAHYIIADGEASLYCFAAMLPQPGALENCYGVTTTATNHLQRYLKEVEPYFKDLMKGIGCRDGVAWVEMILDDDGHFYVLEMGHRLSGDLIEIALKDACGVDSMQWILDTSLGKVHTKADLPASLKELPKKHSFSYIVWSKSDATGTLSKITGVDEIAAIPGVNIVFTERLGEPVEDEQYMFTVNMATEDQEEMIDLVKRINSTVRMEDEFGNNMLLYYDDFDTMRRIYTEGLNEVI